jgi:AraC-like DNA-binding protein
MIVIKNDNNNKEVFREEYCLLIKFKEIRYYQNIPSDQLVNEFSALVNEYEKLLEKIAKIVHTGDVDSWLPGTVPHYTASQLIKNTALKIKGEFLKELEDVIEKNMADPEFNVEELSRKLHMNRVTLYRKVRVLTGETPTEFIRSYRLKRGAELLRNNFGTILDIALEVGFSSTAYFTKCFKKKFNQLPSNVK